MSVKVKFFATFREMTGKKQVSIPAKDVGDLLGELTNRFEELEEGLFEDQEGRKLRNIVNILVNGRNIDFLEGFGTELKDGDIVAIFPPVAGG